jgi:hypothetical protein
MVSEPVCQLLICCCRACSADVDVHCGIEFKIQSTTAKQASQLQIKINKTINI